jgi:murein DD-endopeptidase MepM/ murein hydrolase activator NlpD
MIRVQTLRRLAALFLILVASLLGAPRPAIPAAAAVPPELEALLPAPDPAQGRLFGLPFADPPGPSTWLLGQPYGNTTTAYRWRISSYAAGQGLHFGIDLSARCGTTVVAIGGGTVMKVDAAENGAGPHNLVLDHGNGYASLYGHLLERPRLAVGDPVQRGQAVALTGDPDLPVTPFQPGPANLGTGDCLSRPHLHLEIRDSATLRKAYNPIALIEADWDMLSLAGPFGRGFARNLDNPRQWQFLDDQPEVAFWGPILNEYQRAWPPEWNGR